jgi:hypothetical protein
MPGGWKETLKQAYCFVFSDAVLQMMWIEMMGLRFDMAAQDSS